MRMLMVPFRPGNETFTKRLWQGRQLIFCKLLDEWSWDCVRCTLTVGYKSCNPDISISIYIYRNAISGASTGQI